MTIRPTGTDVVDSPVTDWLGGTDAAAFDIDPTRGIATRKASSIGASHRSLL
jgi:hypothetical protein